MSTISIIPYCFEIDTYEKDWGVFLWGSNPLKSHKEFNIISKAETLSAYLNWIPNNEYQKFNNKMYCRNWDVLDREAYNWAFIVSITSLNISILQKNYDRKSIVNVVSRTWWTELKKEENISDDYIIWIAISKTKIKWKVVWYFFWVKKWNKNVRSIWESLLTNYFWTITKIKPYMSKSSAYDLESSLKSVLLSGKENVTSFLNQEFIKSNDAVFNVKIEITSSEKNWLAKKLFAWSNGIHKSDLFKMDIQKVQWLVEDSNGIKSTEDLVDEEWNMTILTTLLEHKLPFKEIDYSTLKFQELIIWFLESESAYG